MLDRLSGAQKAALLIGVPTTGLLLYVLLRKLKGQYSLPVLTNYSHHTHALQCADQREGSSSRGRKERLMGRRQGKITRT